MQITQIDLVNVKSYQRESIFFTKGTNAICGPNGAGKSTLLEAIGFVLFDCLPVKHKQFVREGQKSASITIHIVAQDTRTYQVVRKCGSRSQYYVYDPEIDQRLVQGKSETIAWLYDFLGVEESADLAALFKDAIGVPQGLLTATFLDRPQNRKNIFNPLLRVDEYENAWEALRDPCRRLDRSLQAQKQQMAGLEAEAKALSRWQEKVTGLRTQIEADKKQRDARQRELKAVTRRKERLEQIKKRMDELERAVIHAKANVKRLDAQLNDAQGAVTRAQQASTVVQETETGHQAYLAAQAKLEKLEKEREKHDWLKETLQTHRTDLALAQQQAEKLESELAAITVAEAEMEALSPQVQRQEQLEDQLNAAQRDADRLADARRNLDQEQQRLTNLTHKLSKIQTELTELTQVERDIDTQRAELDQIAETRDALTTQIATRQTELAQIGAQTTRTMERLDKANQSRDQAQARLAELQSKLADVEAGLEALIEVEAKIDTLQAKLADLDEQRRKVDAQVATHRAELDQTAAQMAVLEASETAECPVCGGPLTPAHRDELLAQNESRGAELDKALAEYLSQADEIAKNRRNQQTMLQRLERKIKRLPRLVEKETLLAQIETQRQDVAQSVASAQAEQDKLAEHQARQAELETELADRQSRHDDIAETWRHTQQTLQVLESRRKALPRPAEADELTEKIAAQQKILQALESTVEQLADAPHQVEQSKTELEALGDPRRDYQRATDTAQRREPVEKDLSTTQTRITELKTQIDALKEKLESYTNLNARIKAERATSETHEADHQRYLEHIREAQSLDKRQTRAMALGEALEAAQTKRDRLVTEQSQVGETYNADAYAALTETYNTLRDEIATLRERLHQAQDRLEEARAEVQRLHAVQAELEAAQSEHKETNALLSLLTTIRQLLREAGPKITQALVSIISQQADRLYADIMGDHSVQLQWTEDYDIVLRSSGREREFKQLSGGEQMAAALAVRLALLREVSGVDVAFFDEPTANLDDNRRDNLAEQILNVKGFAQLFVISHDDTFEQETDHVVRVVKENGVSQLVT